MAKRATGQPEAAPQAVYLIEVTGWDWSCSIGADRSDPSKPPVSEYRSVVIYGRPRGPSLEKVEAVQVELIPGGDLDGIPHPPDPSSQTIGSMGVTNGQGNPESHANIINRGLIPAMKAAGLTVQTNELDEDGVPILAARYGGLHALRHFYAPWCINPEAGGLGLDMKTVQARTGHSSIVITADTYSHLFPRRDDGGEMADAASVLIG